MTGKAFDGVGMGVREMGGYGDVRSSWLTVNRSDGRWLFFFWADAVDMEMNSLACNICRSSLDMVDLILWSFKLCYAVCTHALTWTKREKYVKQTAYLSCTVYKYHKHYKLMNVYLSNSPKQCSHRRIYGNDLMPENWKWTIPCTKKYGEKWTKSVRI